MTDSQQTERKPLWHRINKLFLVVVVIPTLVSGVYFGLIASDVYISQSKFVIYNPQTPSPGTGLSGLLQGVGVGNNSSYAANAVHDYLLSRDALGDLQATLHYRQMVSQRSIDPFNRFGGWVWFDTTFEQLYRYYTRMVADDVDPTTNISSLTVKAYSAIDAQELNRRLLKLAQTLINRLNAQAENSEVNFYTNEVRASEKTFSHAIQALAAYRNKSAVFTPTTEVSRNSKILTALQQQLITTRIALAQIKNNAPRNPQIGPLKKQLSEITQQIQKQNAALFGGNTSISSKSINYQQLTLNTTIAEKKLASAIAALEHAKIQAQQQHFYIEVVVHANRPDEAREPRRVRAIFATFLVTLLLWGVFSVIFAGIREHHER